MLNPTCPNCHTQLIATAAWRESYTVVIQLACACGYETVVRVPNSRFGTKRKVLRKEVTSGQPNLPE